MSDKSTLLRRIRALAAKTIDAGCTEAEAFAAAALMASLCDKYGFTKADIDEPLEPLTETALRATLDTGSYYFAAAIAKFCDCKVFYRKRSELVFFGHETDVLMAEYFMALLGTANETGYKQFVKDFQEEQLFSDKPSTEHYTKSDWQNMRRSFNVGMSHRVSDRLKEMKAGRSATPTAGALVLTKEALVSEEFAKRYGPMYNAPGRAYNTGTAYNAGQASGDKVSLATGVSNKAQLRLGVA